MAEQPRPETGEHAVKILKIPGLEKRGVWGRILMASLAQPEEIASIIDPTKQVEFKFDQAKVSLEKRDYNPVFENLSFKERKEEWGTTPYEEAKIKWREQFTNFMTTKIEAGSAREEALRIIMGNSKTAKAFTETDADNLFKTFCEGKSDTHKLISQITEYVISRKINLTNFQALLPDLKWIASGLFGKKTAGFTTRLADLEFQLHNNSKEVLAGFDSDKEKIRIPAEDERKVLGLLHDSFPVPSKKAPGPMQETVIPADASTVVSTALPVAPVIPEFDKDEDEKDELLG